MSHAVAPLLATFSSYSGDAGVVTPVAGTLLNIVRDDVGSAAAVVAAGGIPLLVSALTRGIRDPRAVFNLLLLVVQRCPATALPLLVSTGGLDRIVGALSDGGDAARVASICDTLLLLAEEETPLLIAAGALPAAILAFGTHAGHDTAGASLCLLLGVLAQGEHVPALSSSAPLLLASLVRFADRLPVAHAACTLLHALAEEPGDAAAVAGAGGIPTLSAIAKARSEGVDADALAGVARAALGRVWPYARQLSVEQLLGEG